MFRSNLIYRSEQLNSEVENYLDQRLGLNQSYYIYRDLIKNLNSTNYFGFETSEILCFKLKSNKIILINSSKFILNYSFSESYIERIQSKMERGGSEYPVEVEIEGQKFNNCLIIFDKSQSSKFFYLFVADSNVTLKALFKTLFVKLLYPVIRKISKVTELEYELQITKDKQLKELRDKYYYVTNAEKALHFVRNKLSPFKNYIQMNKDYKNNKLEDKELQRIIDDEHTKLESNFQLIVDRANKILDKGKNPFYIADTHPLSIIKVLSIVRRVWNYHFGNFEATVKLVSSVDLEKIKVMGNEVGLDLVLSDWIANMKEHGSSYFLIEVDFDEKKVILSFKNGFKKSQQNEIEQLSKDYNSTNKNEILKRNSHGLYTMKLFLEEMNIKSIFSIEDNLLVYKLYLDV
jgi:hypothetical protein